MRPIPFLLWMTLALVVGSTTAPAMDPDGGHVDGEAVVEHLFAKADADGDGVLSSGEYADAGLAEFGLAFGACDADSDGRLTPGEYLEIYRVHHPSGDEIEI